MSMCRLTVDLDEEVMVSKTIPLTGRAKRFGERAFETPGYRTRLFRSSMLDDRTLRLHHSEGALKLELPLEGEPLTPGDRLVLTADRDSEQGTFSTEIGAAVLVRHFLARADTTFISLLLQRGVRPPDLEVDHKPRAAWIALLEALQDTAVAAEARNMTSLASANNYFRQRGLALEVRYSDNRSIDASTLISATRAARRSPKKGLRLEDFEKGSTTAGITADYAAEDLAYPLFAMLKCIDFALARKGSEQAGQKAATILSSISARKWKT